jgi:hypothetical protein
MSARTKPFVLLFGVFHFLGVSPVEGRKGQTVKFSGVVRFFGGGALSQIALLSGVWRASVSWASQAVLPGGPVVL